MSVSGEQETSAFGDNHAEAYEATAGQLDLWMSEQLHANRLSHVIVNAFELNGDVHYELLAEAFRSVYLNLTILRTGLRWARGGLKAIIDKPDPDAVTDIGQLNCGESHDHSMLAMQAIRADPPDLASGKVFKIRIGRCAGGSVVVAMGVHHAATDGWGMRLIMDDLEEAYEDMLAGVNPVLPLRPSYPTLAENRGTSKREWAADADYWSALFSRPAAGVHVPCFRSVDATGERHMTSVAEVGRDFERARMELTKKLRVAPLSPLIGAIAVAMDETGSFAREPICIPTHERKTRIAQACVGPLASMIPIRLDLLDYSNIHSAILTASEQMLEGLKHTSLAYGEILRTAKGREGRDPAIEWSLGVMDYGSLLPVWPGVSATALVPKAWPTQLPVQVQYKNGRDARFEVWGLASKVSRADDIVARAQEIVLQETPL